MVPSHPETPHGQTNHRAADKQSRTFCGEFSPATGELPAAANFALAPRRDVKPCRLAATLTVVLPARPPHDRQGFSRFQERQILPARRRKPWPENCLRAFKQTPQARRYGLCRWMPGSAMMAPPLAHQVNRSGFGPTIGPTGSGEIANPRARQRHPFSHTWPTPHRTPQ
jgi:hypothetical protein